MKLNRNYITPFISLIFLVVGISGLLMFFHLFDGYTEVVHELLGLFFVVCAMFHIVVNWSALRIHFKKGVFIPALLGAIVLSAGFVISERLNPPLDLILINRIVKSPIHDAFKALDIEYDQAAANLKANGISITGAKTIEDLWTHNDIDPETVIDLITDGKY